jgi:hypothetical protein
MKDITMLIQKILGVIIIGIGILCPFIMNGGFIATLMIIPLGLIAIFSKKSVLCDSYFIVDEEEEES